MTATSAQDELLARLEHLARRRDWAESELNAVREEIVQLYLQGRAMEPRVTVPAMAAAMRVTEDAVNKTLRKARSGGRQHMNNRSNSRAVST